MPWAFEHHSEDHRPQRRALTQRWFLPLSRRHAAQSSRTRRLSKTKAYMPALAINSHVSASSEHTTRGLFQLPAPDARVVLVGDSHGRQAWRLDRLFKYVGKS